MLSCKILKNPPQGIKYVLIEITESPYGSGIKYSVLTVVAGDNIDWFSFGNDYDGSLAIEDFLNRYMKNKTDNVTGIWEYDN